LLECLVDECELVLGQKSEVRVAGALVEDVPGGFQCLLILPRLEISARQVKFGVGRGRPPGMVGEVFFQRADHLLPGLRVRSLFSRPGLQSIGIFQAGLLVLGNTVGVEPPKSPDQQHQDPQAGQNPGRALFDPLFG